MTAQGPGPEQDATQTSVKLLRERIAHAFRRQDSDEVLVRLIVEAVASACEEAADG